MLQNHILKMYRLCNRLYYQGRCENKIIFFTVKFLYKYYSTLLGFFYGAYLPYRAQIGINLKLNHSFYGIFISEHSRIGDNCTILQHVTIGSNQPLNDDAPVIGNNVFIGVNCSIVGGANIGNNCIIGAGTTVSNAHIENGATVVGQKYRVIEKK